MNTICLCSSIDFYKDVVDLKNQLVQRGFSVLIPELAEKMERENNFDVKFHKQSFYGKNPASARARAIKVHFKKIARSESILVVNKTKHGIHGYIGANCLMEIGLAYYLAKRIYVLHPILKTAAYFEEFSAINPIVVNGDLSQIEKME